MSQNQTYPSAKHFLATTAALLLTLGALCFTHAHATTKNTTAGASNSTALAAAKKKHKPARSAKAIKGKRFGNTATVRELARNIARQQQLPIAWVTKQLSQARQIPAILPMVLPPASPQQKNWTAYRARFLSDCRIQHGVKFWRDHSLLLDQTLVIYGVAPHYIVGIMGVETFYGKHLGTYKLLDALTTLSVMFPSSHPQAAERQAFFQNELAYFLKQQKTQPSKPAPLGSYAGASGLPQFMPSSIARFAVDFDGNGRIDLSNSAADAIGSVANYFKAYGWQPGMPTHFEVDVASIHEDDLNALLAPDIVPSWSASHLQSKQAVLSQAAMAFDKPLALVQLYNGGNPPSYVAGTENFYVITRYNRSSYYALAVIELGEAVAKAMADPTYQAGSCP
jgi:membrane-bound lytic murein transglycosylase B